MLMQIGVRECTLHPPRPRECDQCRLRFCVSVHKGLPRMNARVAPGLHLSDARITQDGLWNNKVCCPVFLDGLVRKYLLRAGLVGASPCPTATPCDHRTLDDDSTCELPPGPFEHAIFICGGQHDRAVRIVGGPGAGAPIVRERAGERRLAVAIL